MRVRVASAGTGKTTSLVLRFLELVADGTPLRRIAGVTFTRAAADELRGRVADGLDALLTEGHYLHVGLPEGTRHRFEEASREASGATLTTIHGFMSETLRLAAPLLGLEPDFTVLGEWEAEALFEEEVRSLLYLARRPEHPLHGAAQAAGQDATALLLALFGQRSQAESLRVDDGDDRAATLLALYDAAFRSYEGRLGSARLTPSELERRALRLVRMTGALERIAGRYKVVLVDEFQDVNPLQGRFFEALEGAALELEVVGDPKQSIYGFRNADVEVFRRALGRGTTLEPLRESRRHAPLVTRFLNRLTSTFAEAGMGFSAEEAPEVRTKGPQEQAVGTVELHWVTSEIGMDDARPAEGRLLANRLRHHHERGVPYGSMAVLARSYASLELAEGALADAGIPYVLLQGRGYYSRSEIRDLYHALRVDPRTPDASLAAFLRGPFGGVDLELLDRVLRGGGGPLLERERPEVHRRLRTIRGWVRSDPLEALKRLVREPLFEDGSCLYDLLDSGQRQNVDALLFTVARQGTRDLRVLLDELERLSRQADAGDVPQAGEGVSLVTVHRAKGLEWPLVAIFDAGRGSGGRDAEVYVDPGDGGVAFRGSPTYDDLREARAQRDRQESHRLLYVAASRARNTLVVTGCAGPLGPNGWAAALDAFGVGPGGTPVDRDGILLAHYGPADVPSVEGPPPVVSADDRLELLGRRFAAHPFPPVQSPSRVTRFPPNDAADGAAEGHEPAPPFDPLEPLPLPGRGRVVGTLVHFAIGVDWRLDSARERETLRSQDVMFPFTPAEQDDLMREVVELVGNYWSMVGREIPLVSERKGDRAELPMAFPHGATVWQGVIDRLYFHGGRWIVEDYKTDGVVAPERYAFQLAVYTRAVHAAHGVRPAARLVYLRERVVVELEPDELERAFEERVAPTA